MKVHIAEPTFGMQIGEFETEGFVHDPKACGGQFCPFHNPSDHHMKAWPMNIRLDNRALTERICEHGVGHPDPDSVAFFERHGVKSMGVHGCDGCCREGGYEEVQSGRAVEGSKAE